MLLRSYSSPILTSFLSHSMESSNEQQLTHHLHITLATPKHNFPYKKHHSQTPSTHSNILKQHHHRHRETIVEEEEEQEKKTEQNFYMKKTTPSIRELFSSSGLDKQVLDDGVERKVGKMQTLVMGDGGMGCDGGRICGGCNGSGRDSGGGNGNGNGWENNNYGRDETDAYYHNMIQANPNSALLLGNYAKFLFKVCGDYDKAEEYLERAILVNPEDSDILSLYADLIWKTEKNADRAELYFDRAIKSDPDDCYVLASYAKFLWDVEEDEENDCQHKNHTYSPHLFQGSNGRSHVTAAS